MDLNLLETQFFVQAMECKAFLQTIEKARKSILELEQEELEWLGTKDPKGLQFKINELRSLNIKVHETEQNLIENAIKVKENKAEKTDTLLESKLKKLIWQEKVANKSRIECIKEKLAHEKEHRQILYKILKHLSKCEVFLRLAKANRDECADDLVQLEPNIDAWLRSKKADLDRLAKYHGLLHKQKGFEGGLVLDDTTSTSSVDTASEAGSDITPLSILQENIALTVEKQKLEEELKLAKEKKGCVLDRIESIKAANKDMKEKLDRHQKVKEENRRLESAIEEKETEIAKLTEEMAKMQTEVECNDQKICNAENEVRQLREIAANFKDDQEELEKAQKVEEDLFEKKEELDKVKRQIEEKIKDNSLLKDQNRKLGSELEQLNLKNMEMEMKLKNRKDKVEKEANDLKRRANQLQRCVQVKKDNIKNMDEKNKKLDAQIIVESRNLMEMREKLESCRLEKAKIDSGIKEVKSSMSQHEKKMGMEVAEITGRVAELELKLQEKNVLVLEKQENLKKLKQDNEMMKNLLFEVQDLTRQNASEKQQETSSNSVPLQNNLDGADLIHCEDGCHKETR